MVATTVLISQILLAGAALAAPSAGGLAGRIARRREASHLSRPLQLARSSTNAQNNANTTHAEESNNWSGAVLVANSATYTAVTGSFIVPTPSVPSGQSGSSFSSSAWVGIDGDTCDTAILQTGLDFTVSSDGDVSYDAWYEWLPDSAHDFTGISFSAGDSVTVTVTATSTTSGTAVIENTSTGQKVSKDLTSTSALCETNAEWIVEDYEENGGLVPLADFGTVTFTGASATTGSGTVGPDGATIIDLVDDDGNVVATASSDSTTVTVTYQ